MGFEMDNQRRRGTLMDLGPDGYGFVKEQDTGDVWAFALRLLPSADLDAWHGRAVDFEISPGGKVTSISAASARLTVGV